MWWSAVIFFTLGVLVVVTWVSHQEWMDRQFQKWGNGSRVLGLLFGLAALAFTIWTVVETQKLEEWARTRERETIQKANEEIAEARKAIVAAESRAEQRVRAISSRDLRDLCEKAESSLKAAEEAIYEKDRQTQNKWKI